MCNFFLLAESVHLVRGTYFYTFYFLQFYLICYKYYNDKILIFTYIKHGNKVTSVFYTQEFLALLTLAKQKNCL